MQETILHNWDDLEIIKNPNHPGLYQKEFLSAADADAMGIAASSVLYEKLTYHGAVTPHYHSVCEVICLIRGSVMLYANGKWEKHCAGDTFIVPAGMIHSVVNVDPEIESEQISFFIPVSKEKVSNAFFETYMVEKPKIEEVF